MRQRLVSIKLNALHCPTTIIKTHVSALMGLVAVQPAAADPHFVFPEVAFLHAVDSDFAFLCGRREYYCHTHSRNHKFVRRELQQHCRAVRRFRGSIPATSAKSWQRRYL